MEFPYLRIIKTVAALLEAKGSDVNTTDLTVLEIGSPTPCDHRSVGCGS